MLFRSSDFDVLIMPDGNYRFLSDKDGAEKFKEWINKGGRVIAIEGAVGALAKAEFGIKLKKTDTDEKKDEKKEKVSYDVLRKFEDRERDGIPNMTPGSIYKVEMDNSHPLAFGYNNNYFSLKLGSDMYEFMKDGWNVGVIKKENQASGFVGSKSREKIKDGTVIGVQPIGNGSVIFFADDPIFRNFWENGKMMLANAVFLVGQ